MYKWMCCFVGVCAGLWGDGIWVIEEEFVKFGKREVYEEQKRGMEGKWKGKEAIYAVQDLEVPRFLYLTALDSFGGLERFERDKTELLDEYSRDERERFDSVINFRVISLQNEMQECSYMPKGENMLSMPYLSYQVVGIVPGEEGLLEQSAKDAANKLKGKKSDCGLRVWRISYGGDVPKYIISLSAKSEESLEKVVKEVDIAAEIPKNIIRDLKSGKALVRKDLSYNVQ